MQQGQLYLWESFTLEEQLACGRPGLKFLLLRKH